MSKLKTLSGFVVLLATLVHFLIGIENIQGFIDYQTREHNIHTRSCLFSGCFRQVTNCLTDWSCLKTLGCIMKCSSQSSVDKEMSCSYVCEMIHAYENQAFVDLASCMLEHKCFSSVYPEEGICRGSDQDAYPVRDFKKIQGVWWVLNGINCGESPYHGGYDGFPCQQTNLIYQEHSKQWINNVTYCAGKDNICTTNFITTIANVSLPAPGNIHHDYTDAPLLPQVEDWRIISWPNEGDYMLILWCGKLPMHKYNGGFVFSRKRSLKDMPKELEKEFRELSKKFGLDYDNFCISDNTWCPF